MYLLYFKMKILMSCYLTTLLSFEKLGPDYFRVLEEKMLNKGLVKKEYLVIIPGYFFLISL